MTIDYDKLAKLLDKCTPGQWVTIPNCADGEPRPDDSYLIKVGDEYLGIMHGPDAYLTALAPDLARELLTLRAELEYAHSVLTREAEMAERRNDQNAVEASTYFVGLLTEIMDGGSSDH